MNRLLMTFVLALLAAVTMAALPPPPSVEAIVLGVAQDGGVPHLGCTQDFCRRARRDPSLRRLVASLGLVDRQAGKRFLVDATPDLPAQAERLGGLPDAILL